ncbi:MAG: toxin-antitoxin system HicB family antitoxin [Peptostreptococcaceae bacterium]|nr:toxin-antitoxin system HicB family antitoxin [Peptostreptococcaceae bacterium]
MAQSMTIRIDEELHKQAKIKATIEGISLKEYILNLIKEDLAKAAKDTNK